MKLDEPSEEKSETLTLWGMRVIFDHLGWLSLLFNLEMNCIDMLSPLVFGTIAFDHDQFCKWNFGTLNEEQCEGDFFQNIFKVGHIFC